METELPGLSRQSATAGILRQLEDCLRRGLEENAMQTMEFSTEEIEILRDVLQSRIAEIDVEVFRTDTHDFKVMLKHRREVLERILEKFSRAPVAA